MGAFHQGPWICGCPDCLSDLSHSPPQPREGHPFCRLPLLTPGPVEPRSEFDSLPPIVKKQKQPPENSIAKGCILDCVHTLLSTTAALE